MWGQSAVYIRKWNPIELPDSYEWAIFHWISFSLEGKIGLKRELKAKKASAQKMELQMELQMGMRGSSTSQRKKRKNKTSIIIIIMSEIWIGKI